MYVHALVHHVSIKNVLYFTDTHTQISLPSQYSPGFSTHLSVQGQKKYQTFISIYYLSNLSKFLIPL